MTKGNDVKDRVEIRRITKQFQDCVVYINYARNLYMMTTMELSD